MASNLLVFVALFIIGCSAQCTICTGCGNGKCEYPAESCSSCPADCGPCPPCNLLCGNFRCDADKGENSCNCPKDCGVCCEDGVCRYDKGETFFNCPKDCAVRLHGVVVDSVTAAPLNNIDVRCFSAERSYPVINTGGGNAFSIPSVPIDTYTCIAQDASGVYASAFANITLNGKNLNDTVVLGLKFQFCSLMGVAYDNTTDEAIRAADVVCQSLVPTNTTTGERCTSPMGLYFFVNVHPAPAYTCTAKKQGYSDATCTTSCEPGQNHECDLPMDPLPGEIIGTVVDVTSGRGVVANVSCVFADERGAFQDSNTSSLTSYRFGLPTEEIIPGRVRCRATRALYKEQEQTGTVGRGETIRIDFRLVPLPSTISGTLIDSKTSNPVPLSFQPRAECSVENINGGQSVFRATPIQTGGWALSSLNPGNYTCQCHANLYESSPPVQIEVTAGQALISNCLVSPIKAFLTVQAETPASEAVLTASVACILPTGAAHPDSPQLNTNGSTVFGNIDDFGLVNCSASSVGYASGEGSFETKIGENGTLTLILRPTSIIVHTLDGELTGPLGDVLVELTNHNGSCANLASNTSVISTGQGAQATTLPDFNTVCEGTWTVTASKMLYVSNTTTVQAFAGNRTFVELTLTPQTLPINTLTTEDSLRFPNGTINFGDCPNGANFDGNITQDDGQPAFCRVVEGVKVDFWRLTGSCSSSNFNSPGSLDPACLWATLFSNATGWMVPVLIPNRDYYINATRAGFAPTVGRVSFPFPEFNSPNPQKHFRLAGVDATIIGCVRDQDGNAIQRGLIALSETATGLGLATFASDHLKNECGTGPECDNIDGCFRFPNVQLQKILDGYQLRVTATDGTIIPQSATVSVINAGEVVEKNFTVIQTTTGRLSGQTITSISPFNVSAVNLTCTGTSDFANGNVVSVLTDANAFFNFTAQIGSYDCRVVKQDFRIETFSTQVRVGQETDQGQISLIPRKITFQPGAIVDGCGNRFGASPPYTSFDRPNPEEVFDCSVFNAIPDGQGGFTFNGVYNGVRNAPKPAPPTSDCPSPCVDYKDPSFSRTFKPASEPFPALSLFFLPPTNPNDTIAFIECFWQSYVPQSSEPDYYRIRNWDLSSNTETAVEVSLPRFEVKGTSLTEDPNDNFDRIVDWTLEFKGFFGEIKDQGPNCIATSTPTATGDTPTPSSSSSASATATASSSASATPTATIIPRCIFTSPNPSSFPYTFSAGDELIETGVFFVVYYRSVAAPNEAEPSTIGRTTRFKSLQFNTNTDPAERNINVEFKQYDYRLFAPPNVISLQDQPAAFPTVFSTTMNIPANSAIGTLDLTGVDFNFTNKHSADNTGSNSQGFAVVIADGTHTFRREDTETASLSNDLIFDENNTPDCRQSIAIGQGTSYIGDLSFTTIRLGNSGLYRMELEFLDTPTATPTPA